MYQECVSGRTRRHPSESLDEVKKRLRQLAKQHDFSAYKFSFAVCKLADNWDQYRDEAGCEVGAWLSENVRRARPLSWYRRIVEAHDRAGDYAHTMTAEACRWLHGVATNEAKYQACMPVINNAFVERGRMALTTGHLMALLPEMKIRGNTSKLARQSEIGRLRSENKMLSDRIKRLEAQIRANGLEPVE